MSKLYTVNLKRDEIDEILFALGRANMYILDKAREANTNGDFYMCDLLHDRVNENFRLQTMLDSLKYE